MKKRLSTLVLLLCAIALGANAQLLYKITGNGLQKPSYIVGTYHFADASFAEKIPGAKDAIIATDQVYGEIVMSDMLNADSLKLVQSSMLLPDGKTLENVLTTEQYKKVDAYLTGILGAGFSNPQVKAQMGSLNPAALSTQLTTLIYLKNHMGAFDPTHAIDAYFQEQAKANNEPVGGLETLAYQMNLLYKSTPMDRQITGLMCIIEHEDLAAQFAENLTKAYYAQDLDAVKAAIDAKMNNECDARPEETAKLIDNRNANWLKKMPQIMQERPTLFVVGSGHLPGEKGVLQGLKNLGYTVEGVK